MQTERSPQPNSLPNAAAEPPRDMVRYYENLPEAGGVAGKCCMHLPNDLQGMRILNLGCRRGKGSMKLAERAGLGGYVLGVDWMPAHVEAARAYASDHEAGTGDIAPVDALHAYPEALDAAGVGAQAFDMVYANASMNVFFNQQQALAQIARALAPGGLFVADGVFATGSRDLHVVQQARRRGDAVMAAPSLNQFRNMLARAGFDAVTCDDQQPLAQEDLNASGGAAAAESADASESVSFVSCTVHARKPAQSTLALDGVSSATRPAARVATTPTPLPNRIVYLDNAATTQPYESALDVMAHAMREDWGNPSSRHVVGRHASDLLEQCRETVAQAIGAHPREIYFTSGATESNNIAIEGTALLRTRDAGPGHAITSELEHAAITKPVRSLRRSGWKVDYVSAVHGDFDLQGLRRMLRESPRTDLISIMAVQNELGYIFPTAEIARLRRELAPQATFHVDAVQAFAKIPFDVRDWDCDLLTFCSHKIGGPKGIGALYVREGTQLFTTALGGGQERGLRSGTQALPLIMGFAEAVRTAMAGRDRAFELATRLRDRVTDAVLAARPDTVVNSRQDGSPFILSFSVPGTNNLQVMDDLSDRGICISGSSACSSIHWNVSPDEWRKKHPVSVQRAGVSPALTESTYRISFRDTTTIADVDTFLEAFIPLVTHE